MQGPLVRSLYRRIFRYARRIEAHQHGSNYLIFPDYFQKFLTEGEQDAFRHIPAVRSALAHSILGPFRPEHLLRSIFRDPLTTPTQQQQQQQDIGKRNPKDRVDDDIPPPNRRDLTSRIQKAFAFLEEFPESKFNFLFGRDKWCCSYIRSEETSFVWKSESASVDEKYLRSQQVCLTMLSDVIRFQEALLKKERMDLWPVQQRDLAKGLTVDARLRVLDVYLSNIAQEVKASLLSNVAKRAEKGGGEEEEEEWWLQIPGPLLSVLGYDSTTKTVEPIVTDTNNNKKKCSVSGKQKKTTAGGAAGQGKRHWLRLVDAYPEVVVAAVYQRLAEVMTVKRDFTLQSLSLDIVTSSCSSSKAVCDPALLIHLLHNLCRRLEVPVSIVGNEELPLLRIESVRLQQRAAARNKTRDADSSNSAATSSSSSNVSKNKIKPMFLDVQAAVVAEKRWLTQERAESKLVQSCGVLPEDAHKQCTSTKDSIPLIVNVFHMENAWFQRAAANQVRLLDRQEGAALREAAERYEELGLRVLHFAHQLRREVHEGPAITQQNAELVTKVMLDFLSSEHA